MTPHSSYFPVPKEVNFFLIIEILQGFNAHSAVSYRKETLTSLAISVI